MTFFNLIMLQVILVFITDISGWVDNGLTPLFKRLFGIGKPSKIFTCSLCQTWWFGLLYLLITGHFALNWIAIVAILAAFTPVMYLAISFFRDLATKAINELYDYFKI